MNTWLLHAFTGYCHEGNRIADIADNIESLHEVKNIVHKCLTEQFEEMPNDKVKKKGNRKRRQKDHLSMEYE